MGKPHPLELRQRVVKHVEAGNSHRSVAACQRRSKSLPLGRSKSRPVCLIFGYVFWPLQGPEDIVRH